MVTARRIDGALRTLGAPLLLGWIACAPNAATTPPPAATPACTEDDAVDVIHHTVDLSLSLSPPSLRGIGEVRLRTRRPTRTIALDAHHLRVIDVERDSVTLPFRVVEDRLCADLGEPVPTGTEIALEMLWEVPTDGATPKFSADEVWAGYRASAWMPTRQDPSQRATLSLRVTAPSALRVVASGRAVEREATSNDRTVHTFTLDRPTPPFLYAFAAGRFDAAELEIDGTALRALGPRGSDLKHALDITAPMHRFMIEHLGAAFPSTEYTQVFVRGDAAQEAAGLSILSAASLDDERADPTEDWIFAHELAHQWFAWLVPCADFDDFWLNEGFASFLVAAYKEHRWGRAAYDREIQLFRKRSAKVHADARDAPLSRAAPTMGEPGSPPRRPMRESDLPPRGVTYARGALVLHKLREELGEATFWRGVQGYVRERAGKGARSDDLRGAMERASGRDLRGFFATWVYASAPGL